MHKNTGVRTMMAAAEYMEVDELASPGSRKRGPP